MTTEEQRRARELSHQLRRSGCTFQQIADAVTFELRLPSGAYTRLHAVADVGAYLDAL